MLKRKDAEQYPIALWRRAIVAARIKLASDDLTPADKQALWQSIDCREWFIKVVASDYAAELEQIDRDIEAALRTKKTFPTTCPPVDAADGRNTNQAIVERTHDGERT